MLDFNVDKSVYLIMGPKNGKNLIENDLKQRPLRLCKQQAMAEQGHTRSLSSKLNLKMNWDGQLGPSVAKLWLNKNMVDM